MNETLITEPTESKTKVSTIFPMPTTSRISEWLSSLRTIFSMLTVHLMDWLRSARSAFSKLTTARVMESFHHVRKNPKQSAAHVVEWARTPRGLYTIPIVIVALAIFIGIISRIWAEMALAKETNAAPYVSVVHPKPTSQSSEIVLPGNTEAFISTPIFARTNGYLKAWYADIGTQVKQGQLLAEIETPELDQQLDQARADLKNAQANLQISATTNKRYQDLVASNAVSHQEADTALADLRSKQALVDSGEANVRRLEQLQDYEKIYAPFDGTVTVRNIDIGSLIQTTNTRELFHLASLNKLRVYVSVPEVYSALVKNGGKATLTVDAFPGQTFDGVVARNSASIDMNTRTLNVEVDVDNPANKLIPGAYVFVHLPLPSTANSLTVPSNALLFRAEGPRVGVVTDGHARLRPVTIGHDFGNSLEILSGLTLDDEIILDPSDSLTDGMPVQVTTESKVP